VTRFEVTADTRGPADWTPVVRAAAWALFLFQLFLPVYAFLPELPSRAVHLGLTLVLVFSADQPGYSALQVWPGRIFAVLGFGICAYVFFDHGSIATQYGLPRNEFQVLAGGVLIVLVLEAARRAVRPALPLVAALFLAYALWGHWIPGRLGHPPYAAVDVISMLFLTSGGLWGQLLGVSAHIIAIFVFLGAAIGETGGGEGFRLAAVRLAGRRPGGPALAAAASSALFGSISGSASANVASTGSFTIPMMKRLGYPSHLAAAVEAVASTGGQIVPPIMGAGAFVLAELIGTPYLRVAGAAALPAVLYFVALFAGIRFFAARRGYQGLSDSDIPSWRSAGRAGLFFLGPFAMLAAWLAAGYTPQYAAFWAVWVVLSLSVFDPSRGFEPKTAPRKIDRAVVAGARQAAGIAAICACAQIIIAVIGFTGLGVKITEAILAVGMDRLWITLILTGAAALVLGMEVPTTGAYVVAAVVAGPVLEHLGLPLLVGHLFIFYMAILSAVTPPVCGAVFIAAGIAGADWSRSAGLALKLSFGLFLIPFYFAYHPALLGLDSFGPALAAAGLGAAGLIALSAGFMGHWVRPLTALGRGMAIGGGLLILAPHWPLKAAGLALCAAALVSSSIRPRFGRRKRRW
jgi:TRAP transporter 4TM/12TM fusion protein